MSEYGTGLILSLDRLISVESCFLDTYIAVFFADTVFATKTRSFFLKEGGV